MSDRGSLSGFVIGNLRFNAAILWGRDGDVLLDEVELTRDLSGRFEIDVYAPPPERFLRPAEVGAIALGQIIFDADLDGDGERDPDEALLGHPDTLVGWTPEGARGGLVLDPLPRGLHALRATAPCDEAPMQVHRLRDGETLDVQLARGQPLDALFSAPNCVAHVPHATPCPSLTATRWWCRHGPATAGVCDRCEYYLFPVGADHALCDTWFDHCVANPNWNIDANVCWSEWRVCTAGEPAPAAPCDLACACAKLATFCRADPYLTQCVVDLPGCDWREVPP